MTKITSRISPLKAPSQKPPPPFFELAGGNLPVLGYRDHGKRAGSGPRKNLWFSTVHGVLIATCLLSEASVAQTPPELSPGTPTLSSQFANPPQPARPNIRFWTPGAAVTDVGLRADIDAIAQSGFGGLEIVAFSLPKGVESEFEWGGQAWNGLMTTAAEQAGKNGIIVDFTNGPKWPIAMPGVDSADDPAALHEMTYGSVILEPGQPFSGVVPARRKVRKEGTTKLAATMAYRMTGDKVLDLTSVIDLSATVHIDPADHARSTVKFTAPHGSDPWVLITFWEQPAAQMTAGHYVIDHFSAAGAKACIEYWENVAIPALGENLRHVRSIFNDSLEYAVAMDWTRGMRDLFKDQYGYDILPYLPFVGMAGTYPANDIPGYKATDEDIISKVQHDYFEALTTLYVGNHLRPLQEMAERHGLNIRYQAAYNKPMQIATSALAVGIPETEALGRAALDMQRWMAGAVHLAGKPLYSIETSAEMGNSYGQTLQDILWWNKRAWAAGVNIQRFHGQSYSGVFDGPGNVAGQLPGQKWPGYGAMFAFSNNWMRQSSPEHLRQTVAYMARVNVILQKQAKVDIAIYSNSPDIYCTPSVPHGDGIGLYPDGGVLNAHGFSYDFVSPALLDLPEATATGGRLGSAGPAYKALILHHESMVTMHVVDRLKQFATAGLAIVFVGEPPRRNASYADQLRGHSDARIHKAVAELLNLPKVATVGDYAAVPEALRRLGVRADAEAADPVDVLTQHRTDATGDYYYLYNYNKLSNHDATDMKGPSDGTTYPSINKAAHFVAKTARFSLAGTGRPYLLNPWTGTITAIPQFTTSDGRVHLTVHLAGDEAVLVAILNDKQAQENGVRPPAVWAVGSDLPYGAFAYARDGKLGLKARRNGSYTIRLNAGREASAIVSDPQPEQVVMDWSLSIESIEAPANGSALFRDSTWRTIGPYVLGAALKPWREISPDLARVSGIGTYTGTFTLERGHEHGGSAYLDLGEIDDAFTITLNGTRLPPLDLSKTEIDLGPYAISGTNTLTIRVATTLFNKVASPRKAYGLVGTDGAVTVRPYRLLHFSDE